MGLGLGSAGVGMAEGLQELIARRLQEEQLEAQIARQEALTHQGQQMIDLQRGRDRRSAEESAFQRTLQEDALRRDRTQQDRLLGLAGSITSSSETLPPLPAGGVESEAPTPGILTGVTGVNRPALTAQAVLAGQNPSVIDSAFPRSQEPSPGATLAERLAAMDPDRRAAILESQAQINAAGRDTREPVAPPPSNLPGVTESAILNAVLESPERGAQLVGQLLQQTDDPNTVRLLQEALKRALEIHRSLNPNRGSALPDLSFLGGSDDIQFEILPD